MARLPLGQRHGARLRELRLLSEMTGPDVAAAVSVSRFQLYRYETDKADVPGSKLDIFAALYHCDVADLFAPIGASPRLVRRRRVPRVGARAGSSSRKPVAAPCKG